MSHDEASYDSLGPYELVPDDGHWLGLINDACCDAVLGKFADVEASQRLIAEVSPPSEQIEQIEQLAIAVVEDWDMDTLIGYARQQLAAHYQRDPQSFAADWAEHFPVDDLSEEDGEDHH